MEIIGFLFTFSLKTNWGAKDHLQEIFSQEGQPSLGNGISYLGFNSYKKTYDFKTTVGDYFEVHAVTGEVTDTDGVLHQGDGATFNLKE